MIAEKTTEMIVEKTTEMIAEKTAEMTVEKSAEMTVEKIAEMIAETTAALGESAGADPGPREREAAERVAAATAVETAAATVAGARGPSLAERGQGHPVVGASGRPNRGKCHPGSRWNFHLASA